MDTLLKLTLRLKDIDFSSVSREGAIDWVKREAKINGLNELETKVLIENVLPSQN